MKKSFSGSTSDRGANAMHRLTVTVLAAATILVGGIAARPEAQAPAPAQPGIALPVRLTAFAVNMSNIGTGTSGVLEINIDRWSPAAERKTLIETMLTKGQDSLLSALQKTKSKGRMRFPGWMGPDPHQLRLGWDLHYAWAVPLPEGGHQIVVATDRYIGFAEARNQPRTVDYPFTLIQIHLNKDGEGQGTFAVATKISFDKKKNTVELENYSSEPVRLNNVKMESAKKKT
jgi:hypothetical protein